MAVSLNRVLVQNKQSLLKSIPLNRFSTKAKLTEIGKILPAKEDGKYETGQLFLHRVFGYRGVVLIPWATRVYNRDLMRKSTIGNDGDDDNEDKGENHSYYQVLVDSRDIPHIQAQMEVVTFFGNHQSHRGLSVIPGLDYAPHEDIMPYQSTEPVPLHHELFKKFLTNNPKQDPQYTAQNTLELWQKKNHPWLRLSEVHIETTEDVRVTVIPFYMGWRERTASYWWRYCVRLENFGNQAVQLRERNWTIFSLTGTLESIKGRGVVGQEPKLTRKHPAFQYSSHVSLQSPNGHVWGSFEMEREDGYKFDCKIPAFPLRSEDSEDLNDII